MYVPSGSMTGTSMRGVKRRVTAVLDGRLLSKGLGTVTSMTPSRSVSSAAKRKNERVEVPPSGTLPVASASTRMLCAAGEAAPQVWSVAWMRASAARS